jgi:hypothetical protein
MIQSDIPTTTNSGWWNYSPAVNGLVTLYVYYKLKNHLVTRGILGQVSMNTNTI